MVNKSPLRAWQIEAFDHYLQHLGEGGRSLLWEATPGAGKTTAALRVVKHQLATKRAERAFIVVPTSHLRIQWAKAALTSGIHLDSNFGAGRRSLGSDFHGAVVTYQQFKGNEKHFSALATRSVVILDEVHHAAEGLSWGTSIIQTMKDARFILGLSGTAFRSDNNPIPFVKYDQDGVSKSDFTYSYTRAIREKVCRPAAIFSYGGEVSWIDNDKIYRAAFSDNLDYQASARRLRSALDPTTNWIRPLLKDAHEMLLSTRKEQSNAGGLMVCPDQKTAREMAKVVQEVCGEKPTLILSDDAGASGKIKSFLQGSSYWLVACNMVSEGVDIPRLRVGVYATTIKSKLYFRQFLGRIVRRLPHPPGPQVAYLYLPADPTLLKLAEEVELESQHFLKQPKESFFDELESRESSDTPTRTWSAVDATNSGVNAIILHGNQLSLFGGVQGSDNLHRAINQEVEIQQEHAITKSDRKSQLASQLRKLVGTLHKRTGKSHAQIHTQINKAQGVRTQTECTLKQLEERVLLLERLIGTERGSAFQL